MLIKNAKRWAPAGGKGYAMALLAFAMAFSLRYALHNFLDPLLPYLTFFIAVMIIQYQYGLGPALLVVVISIPTGMYFFIPPYNTLSFAGTEVSDLLEIMNNAATSGLGIMLVESLQRSRYEARLLAEVARTRYEVLLRSESERQSAVASARLTREHFRTFTSTVGEVLYMRRVGGGFEYVSDVLAEISGILAVDLMGGVWLSVMHPEDAATIQEQILQLQADRQPALSEFRWRTASGEYVVFEGKLSVMEDDRGLVLRWTGSMQAASS